MINEELLKESIKNFLIAIDENPERDGLVDTPNRIFKMCKEFEKTQNIEYKSFSNTNYNDFVLVKNIEFSSFCEHHILPFYGVVHIAYIPDGKVLGLSKLARIVDKHSKKLQVQERLTSDILQDLNTNVKNKGIAILIEAKHMCMTIRGVKKTSATTVTQLYTGDFKDFSLKQNFLIAISGMNKNEL